MSRRKTERLLGLVVCLLSSERYLTAIQIRAAVPGYPESFEAFKRMFERDKEELRELGIPLETGSNSALDEETGVPHPAAGLRAAGDPAGAGRGGRAVAGRAGVAAGGTGRRRGRRAAQAARRRGGRGGDAAARHRAAAEPARPRSARCGRRCGTGGRSPSRYRAAGPQRAAAAASWSPWGVVNRHGRWYVAGHDADRDAVRVFRLSRIEGAGPVHRARRVGDRAEGHRCAGDGPGVGHPAAGPADRGAAGAQRGWVTASAGTRRRCGRTVTAGIWSRRRSPTWAGMPSTWPRSARTWSSRGARRSARGGHHSAEGGAGVSKYRSARHRLGAGCSGCWPWCPTWSAARWSGWPRRRPRSGSASVNWSTTSTCCGASNCARPTRTARSTCPTRAARSWSARPSRWTGRCGWPWTRRARCWSRCACWPRSARLGPAGEGSALSRTIAKLEAAAGEAGVPSAQVAVQVDKVAQRAVLTQLQDALARARLVHLSYYVPGRDEATERDVDPMRLLVVDGRTYLEGWCRRAEAVRLFRLDRVLGLQVLDAARRGARRGGAEGRGPGAVPAVPGGPAGGDRAGPARPVGGRVLPV